MMSLRNWVNAVLKWLGFIVFDVIFSLTVLVVWLEVPYHFVFFQRQNDPPVWANLGGQPGHPDAAPKLVAMRYGPWPQPISLNFSAAVWAPISVEQPVIVKGRPNHTRYWNFVIYPSSYFKKELPTVGLNLRQHWYYLFEPSKLRRHNAELPSIGSKDVILENDSSYVISFSPKTSGKNWVNTGDISGGILVMRNYFPDHNSNIALPDVYLGQHKFLDGKVYDYSRILSAYSFKEK